MKIPIYDYAGVAIALILLVGLLGLAAFGRPAPAYLSDAFKISLGAVFRSSIAVANEYRHRPPSP